MNTIKNDLTQKYNKGLVIIHWVTALLIIGLFPLGKYLEELEAADKMGVLKLHAILGLVVLGLTIIRSVMYFTSARPPHLKTGSAVNDKIMIWIHNAFYFLMLGIGLSGVATMILGGYKAGLLANNPELFAHHGELPSLGVHNILATILMVLLVLHVIGVVKHYVQTKENALRRMM